MILGVNTLEHELIWLWLTSKFHGSNAKIAALVEFFGGIEEIYASKRFYNIGLSNKEKDLLLDKDLSPAEKICEELSRIGGKILAIDNENYPKILKQSHNPPLVLYLKGKVPDLDDVLTLGVVGTRRPSKYGSFVTKRMCQSLARQGVVTISGMAKGIDAVGAWATVEEGGIAVGVIASGIDIAYPQENAELYQAVAEKGCILTEFPPGTPPKGINFPIRNCIIAGLSRGVLVTDAPSKSGALITAKLAMEEGRDVFAIPRNITDIKYSGTNILIQQGAKLVMHPNDILSEYPYAKRIEPTEKIERKEQPEAQNAPGEKTAPRKKKEKADINSLLEKLSESEKQIAGLLIKKDMQIDEISREISVPVGTLNTRLIMLEMKGVVIKLPGSMYRLKTDQEEG